MKTLRNTMPPSEARRAAAHPGSAAGALSGHAGTVPPQAGMAQQPSDRFSGRVIKVGPAKVPSRPITLNRH